MPITPFHTADLWLLVPEIGLTLGAMLCLVIGAYGGNKTTGVITLMAAMLFLVGAAFIAPVAPEATYGFYDLIRIDGFTQAAKTLILIASFLVVLLSLDWVHQRTHRRFEFPVLMLLSVVGSMIMVSANDLLTVYVGLELSSLSLYVLASFDRDELKSSEAGLKYFVLGALASGMMLFGASLVYGFAGSTNFSALAELFSGHTESSTAVSAGLVVGLVMLMVGFCFKISAVPFHMWTPDVYEGAPTPVTAFFATAPKIAALALFVRFLFQPFGDLAPYWQQIIVIVAISSMLVGALGAIAQSNLKRLLAYGSIGHIGYNLIGLATADVEGAKGVLIYLSLYLFMAIGTFGFLLIMKRGGNLVEQISDLSGLAKTKPRAAFFLAVMMFSMAGIPPFAGFYGKMFVFLSAIEAGMYTLAIIGVLTSAIAAFYYLKIIKVMYFDEPQMPMDRMVSMPSTLVLGACFVVTVGYFLYPTFLVVWSETAAKALLY
jgi:NADH-quinone oxidoreductase subunit N